MKTDYTKKAFADALYELLREKHLDRIRISEICQMSGFSKETFYYHFADKYDLAVYMYNQKISKEYNELSEDHLAEIEAGNLTLCDLDPETSPECILKQCLVWDDDDRCISYNLLYSYEVNSPFYKRAQAAVEGRKKILRDRLIQEGLPIDEEFVELAAQMLKGLAYYFQQERWYKIVPSLQETRLSVLLGKDLLDFWIEEAKKGLTFQQMN